MQTNGDYLTWKQAAAAYGIAPRTLKYMAAKGQITRHRQLGRRETLLAREELDRVLAPRPVAAKELLRT